MPIRFEQWTVESGIYCTITLLSGPVLLPEGIEGPEREGGRQGTCPGSSVAALYSVHTPLFWLYVCQQEKLALNYPSYAGTELWDKVTIIKQLTF